MIISMGKLSRTKGHNFEREVAGVLRDIFPEAKRQLEYQEDECKGVDIANTGKYKIQCKCKKKYVSVNTMKEIQCGKEDVPIVVTKAMREEPMAILPWKDLINLIRDAESKPKPDNRFDIFEEFALK